MHGHRLSRLQRHPIDAHALVFEDWLARGRFLQTGRRGRSSRRLEKLDRQIMKRRRPNIYRAMNIGRFAKVDVAELPKDLGGFGANSLDAKARSTQRNDDIVSAVNMPESSIAGGHRDIKDPHE